MTATPPPPADRPPDEATGSASETSTEPGDTSAGSAPQKAAGSGPDKASGAAPLPLGYAGLIAVLLVVAAVGAGLAIGTIARPSPTPRPTPTPTLVPTRTPEPTTDPRVFRQQLSSGCSTDQGIWVVSSGGGILRYDGQDWTQIDSTLRTLTHTSCDDRTLYAVGPVGAVLILDDRQRSINSFDVTLADLRGVAAMPQGAMTSGAQGTVMLLSGGTWQPYASGIDEDLNGLLVFGLESAWAVGSQGISYRLEAAGWRQIRTGVDVTLHAIAGATMQSAVAVGDGGTIVALSSTVWSKVESGTVERLRAVAVLASTAWAVGDNGVVLAIDGALQTPGSPTPEKPTVVERVDIGTACTLTSVFSRGPDVWIVGSSSGLGGVWRIRDKKVAERWGEC